MIQWNTFYCEPVIHLLCARWWGNRVWPWTQGPLPWRSSHTGQGGQTYPWNMKKRSHIQWHSNKCRICLVQMLRDKMAKKGAELIEKASWVFWPLDLISLVPHQRRLFSKTVWQCRHPRILPIHFNHTFLKGNRIQGLNFLVANTVLTWRNLFKPPS